MAAEAIYKYLLDTNRPYSANDIMTNLHNEYGKTSVQKVLDQLAESGKIKEKTYGKQKVYSIIQPEEDKANESEISDLDKEIANLDSNNRTVESELKASESQLKELKSKPTTNEASEIEKDLIVRVDQLKVKLKELSQNKVKVSPEERDHLKKEREKYVKEYRKRKRMCMDIINGILEGYPKSKKILLEELGIETDEDVNMKPLL